jgi:hypothetical protein
VLLGLAALDAHAGRRPADADIDKATAQSTALDPLKGAGHPAHLVGIAVSASERVSAHSTSPTGQAAYRRADGIRARHGRHPACRGGKANRHFLRGFNPDDGGDFATHVDAVPVNLPPTVAAMPTSTSSFRTGRKKARTGARHLRRGRRWLSRFSRFRPRRLARCRPAGNQRQPWISGAGCRPIRGRWRATSCIDCRHASRLPGEGVDGDHFHPGSSRAVRRTFVGHL